MSRLPDPDVVQPEDDIAAALHWAAEFLPAQGPLTGFIHHNTLHAFQHLPFEQAVVEGGLLYGCEPYMSEEWYRSELARGRITAADLEWALQQHSEESDRKTVVPGVTRRQLRLALLRYHIYQLPPERLRWHLTETGALWRFRPQLEAPLRAKLEDDTIDFISQGLRADSTELCELIDAFPEEARGRDAATTLREEPRVLAPRVLWTACRRRIGDRERVRGLPATCFRYRDRLVHAGLPDIDDLVHPVLIRWCATFLDQGVAGREMPGRELGFYQALRAIYQTSGWVPARWMSGLDRLFHEEEEAGWSGRQSLENSLRQLAVPKEERAEFLRATSLALKGWAGMMYQSEIRPDRLPLAEVPARLEDFLAVRLLLERLALSWVLREELGETLALEQIRSRFPTPALQQSYSGDCLAFELYQVCQFLGQGPDKVRSWSDEELDTLLDEVDAFDNLHRREVMHQAYEHQYETLTLDALLAHPPTPESEKLPIFQAVFCIDEREESTRRHLEEIEPDCETVGTAGFFGIPMYFKALQEPHPVALCPVVIKPRHLVEEVPLDETEARRLESMRRSLGTLSLQLHTGSHTLTWGSLLTSGLGLLASIPDILRVLFPRAAGLFARQVKKKLLPPRTRLQFVRPDEEPAREDGLFRGFTVAEIANIVGNVLSETGMQRRLAPLVLFLGHGSSSLNNPHEAAHDCGACGGGRGGPNGRTFAAMANLPEVRQLLRERGIVIPDETVFVGGYHNTCDDEVELFDLDKLSAEQLLQLEHARSCLQKARARDAQERCRRFESASPRISPRSALAHVEGRAEDLAQPRPEYGHATNAVCFVGRRTRTRGLYMDRRTFLVSYDPTVDDAQGTLLGRVLGAVVPVGAGINLEYYFSFTDNTGYGCGTKLPHNITALLGVMDGFSSDLRTGLPWQMVEIHEPVRLLSIVETKLEPLLETLKRMPQLVPWVANRWIKLALLDPDSQKLTLFKDGQWVPYEPWRPEPQLPLVNESRDWYQTRREHLGYAEIAAGADRK